MGKALLMPLLSFPMSSLLGSKLLCAQSGFVSTVIFSAVQKHFHSTRKGVGLLAVE